MDNYSEQTPPLSREWGILDSELSGFTYDGPTGEAEAREALERYKHPSEELYTRLVSPWVPDGATRFATVPSATWDPLAAAAYIYLQNPGTPVASTSHNASVACNVDFDEQGEIIGIEVLL